MVKWEEVRETLRQKLLHWKDYAVTLLKWLVFSLVVGVSVGVVGALFHMAIDRATGLREAQGWILYLHI